jgi:DNA-binding NarL/FixJ family response regulator
VNAADGLWRVLVVDDHPLVRNGLRAALREVLPGARIEEAGSGPEALAGFATHRPHLVLLDLNLPGIGGLDLAREMRAADRQVKLLMVAAQADLGPCGRLWPLAHPASWPRPGQ